MSEKELQKALMVSYPTLSNLLASLEHDHPWSIEGLPSLERDQIALLLAIEAFRQAKAHRSVVIIVPTAQWIPLLTSRLQSIAPDVAFLTHTSPFEDLSTKEGFLHFFTAGTFHVAWSRRNDFMLSIHTIVHFAVDNPLVDPVVKELIEKCDETLKHAHDRVYHVGKHRITDAEHTLTVAAQYPEVTLDVDTENQGIVHYPDRAFVLTRSVNQSLAWAKKYAGENTMALTDVNELTGLKQDLPQQTNALIFGTLEMLCALGRDTLDRLVITQLPDCAEFALELVAMSHRPVTLTHCLASPSKDNLTYFEALYGVFDLGLPQKITTMTPENDSPRPRARKKAGSVLAPSTVMEANVLALSEQRSSNTVRKTLESPSSVDTNLAPELTDKNTNELTTKKIIKRNANRAQKALAQSESTVEKPKKTRTKRLSLQVEAENTENVLLREERAILEKNETQLTTKKRTRRRHAEITITPEALNGLPSIELTQEFKDLLTQDAQASLTTSLAQEPLEPKADLLITSSTVKHPPLHHDGLNTEALASLINAEDDIVTEDLVKPARELTTTSSAETINLEGIPETLTRDTVTLEANADASAKPKTRRGRKPKAEKTEELAAEPKKPRAKRAKAVAAPVESEATPEVASAQVLEPTHIPEEEPTVPEEVSTTVDAPRETGKARRTLSIREDYSLNQDDELDDEDDRQPEGLDHTASALLDRSLSMGSTGGSILEGRRTKPYNKNFKKNPHKKGNRFDSRDRNDRSEHHGRFDRTNARAEGNDRNGSRGNSRYNNKPKYRTQDNNRNNYFDKPRYSEPDARGTVSSFITNASTTLSLPQTTPGLDFIKPKPKKKPYDYNNGSRKNKGFKNKNNNGGARKRPYGGPRPYGPKKNDNDSSSSEE